MKIVHLGMAVLVACGLNLYAQEADSKVADAIKGTLIGVSEGKAVDVELKGAPEYYVFYFSASW
jgi:hypothetical protein